jgi:hypothetical protein
VLILLAMHNVRTGTLAVWILCGLSLSGCRGSDEGSGRATGGSAGGEIGNARGSASGTAPRGDSSTGGSGASGGTTGIGGNTNGGRSEGGESAVSAGGSEVGQSSVPGAGRGGVSSTGAPPLPPALTFKSEPTPHPGYRAIWGSGTEILYAVGNSGAIARRAAAGTWSAENSDTSAILTGIWGSGPNDVYVSVRSNFMLHSTGDGSWVHQPAPSGMTFEDVWGTGAASVYAASADGVVLAQGGVWDFANGQSVTGGTAAAASIWGSSATDLYLATSYANRPTIYHSSGDGSWRAQAESPKVSLLRISGSGPNRIYAAGDTSVYASTGDGKWTQELTASSGTINSVWALSSVAVYACTTNGLFYRSNGAGAWSQAIEIDPAKPEVCLGIWGLSPGEIYLATSSGVYRGTP